MTKEIEFNTQREYRRRKGGEIYPNVDLYSASVYHMLGIPDDLFTPIFAVARVPGWAAHIIEEKFPAPPIKPELYRPSAQYEGNYCGVIGCKYEPIAKRANREPTTDKVVAKNFASFTGRWLSRGAAFWSQLVHDSSFNFQNMFCYLDSFGANHRASVVGFAAPCTMRLIHNLQAFQHVFDAAVKNVSVRPDDGGWTNISWVFFLADWAGGDATGAHDAFYVIVKLRTLLNRLPMFFAFFAAVKLIPCAGEQIFPSQKTRPYPPPNLSRRETR